MTLPEPTIEHRPAQPYLAIPATVTMATLSTELPPLLPRLFDALAARGIRPSGAPFWKYNVIDMPAQLQVEVGVPVTDAAEGQQDIQAGLLPAGSYATLLYCGHPDGLVAASASLLAWAATAQRHWDVHPEGDGEHWRCRLEEYLTNPATEPNMANWQIRLAFKLADQPDIDPKPALLTVYTRPS